MSVLLELLNPLVCSYTKHKLYINFISDMAYMDRLGLWGEGTQFPTFKEFAHEISEAGVGAMEMVAMEMKSRGIYCRYVILWLRGNLD